MRISLKQILLVVTLLSIYLGALFMPDGEPYLTELSFLAFFGFSIILPSINAAGITYASGYHRAFWIGVTSPCAVNAVIVGVLAFETAWDWNSGNLYGVKDLFALKATLSYTHAAAVIAGAIAVLLRWAYVSTALERGATGSDANSNSSEQAV